jgi:hypothetical protein
MIFRKKVQPNNNVAPNTTGAELKDVVDAGEPNNERRQSKSTSKQTRTERLAPFYAAAKADLLGEHDYTLVSPMPSSILISDENDTVGSQLLGYSGDNILRSLVFRIWLPALLFQLMCVPVGMLVLTGKIPPAMSFLTIPGCISPILLILRSHWQVMKRVLNTWEVSLSGLFLS